jgi:chemotaxis protein methyltransferase CheR
MEQVSHEVAESEFQVAREFLAAKTGLNYPESKREELMTVLQDRVAALGRHRDAREYIDFLRREEDGGRELRGLVTHLTVGETYFFRNRAQFAALGNHILPEAIARKRGKRQRLRIWSAGCSSGEEAYSLAILLLETVPDLAAWEVQILATDINEDSLAAGREGVYRSWSFREVEDRYRQQYFVPAADTFRIRPEVRRMVTFRYLNLADDIFPAAVNGTDAMDLILCRNVMIYFRPELCLEVTRRFFQALEPEGALVVGHSEHSDLIYPGFSRKFFGRGIVYQKSGAVPAWEKGIAIRFRGSGPPPKGVVAHGPGGAHAAQVQRPRNTEETLCFERAVALVGELRASEAVAEFQRVLEVNPRNERALYSIAMLLANAGDNEAADGWAARLLEVNPLHLEATYLRAIIAREAGDREREIAALRKTLYLNPDFVLGHFQSGVYHLRGGSERLARRSFQNVLALLAGREPGDPVAGVDGMTVGRLRETVLGLMPGVRG